MNVEIALIRIDRHTNGPVARVGTLTMDGLCIAKRIASNADAVLVAVEARLI